MPPARGLPKTLCTKFVMTPVSGSSDANGPRVVAPTLLNAPATTSWLRTSRRSYTSSLKTGAVNPATRAPVATDSRTTSLVATPSSVENFPPTYALVPSAAGMIAVTSPLRTGANEGSMTPVVASKEARYFWSTTAPPPAGCSCVKVPADEQVGADLGDRLDPAVEDVGGPVGRVRGHHLRLRRLQRPRLRRRRRSPAPWRARPRRRAHGRPSSFGQPSQIPSDELGREPPPHSRPRQRPQRPAPGRHASCASRHLLPTRPAFG